MSSPTQERFAAIIEATHAVLATLTEARREYVRLRFCGTEHQPAQRHESIQRLGLEALLSGRATPREAETVLRQAWREDWAATRDAILLGLASL